MALSSATVLEVRIGGNDTNGGGFVTGATGTDWSQQDAAQYSVTDGVTNGSTVITSASAGFGTDVVGNLVYVQGGTGAVSSGWYQIITRTSSTTIVVDRATGLTSGTGTTLKIGGALASPGQTASFATVSGMITYIKYYSSASYIVTSSISNVPNGCPLPSTNTVVAGYDTARSLYTIQNRPTIQLSTAISGVNVFGGTNNDYSLQTVIVDASSQTGTRCVFMSGEFFYVKGAGGVTGGLNQNSATGRAVLCEATGCSASPINTIRNVWCSAYSNTLTSPTNNAAMSAQLQGAIFVNCLSYNNNCDGFGAGGLSVNCVAYGNGGSGFNSVNNADTAFYNCISEANSSYGYRANTGRLTVTNCADYNNGVGRITAGTGTLLNNTGVTGTGSFFTNAAGGVFTLNNTAGAGAALRAAGFPSYIPPSTSNTDFADVGALQSSNSGGGTTTAIYGVMGS